MVSKQLKISASPEVSINLPASNRDTECFESRKSMATPHVSIGMPVYNGENYIGAALDSILAQSYTDFELIICDNDSSDHTLQIVEKCAASDARIRVFKTENNQGAAWNYNRTVQLARGEYFRWNAHDDLVAPDALERCIAVLDGQPDTVLCYPKTMIIDTDGHDLRPHDDRLNLLHDSPYERFTWVLTRLGECNAVFGLIRLADLRKTACIGNYIASDCVLLAELALIGKFAEVEDSYFYRRDHQQSSMRAFSTNEELEMWFDTKKTQPMVMRNIRFAKGYALAIWRVPISGSQRLKCFIYLIRWICWNRNGIFAEIDNALTLLIRRALCA